MVRSTCVVSGGGGRGPGAALCVAVVGLMLGCGSSSSQVQRPEGMTTAVDKARCDDSGKEIVTSDTNGDKVPDVIRMYRVQDAGGQKTQILVCRQVDLNHDRKIDIVDHFGDDGIRTFEEFDLDFDGRFDLRAFYQGGRKVREEMDTNYDQRVDFTKYYEGDRLVRIERDANNDGKVDEWQYYEAGKLDRIGYDTNGSGQVDRWERAPEGGLVPATTASSNAPAAEPTDTQPPPATEP